MLFRFYIYIVLCTTICCGRVFAESGPQYNFIKQDSALLANKQLHEKELKASVALFKTALNNQHPDSVELFKKIGLSSAELNNPVEAGLYMEKYIVNSLDFDILQNSTFDSIESSPQFQELKTRYLPKVDLLIFLYFYIALIGFYFVITLNLDKKSDKVAKMLIGGFIAVHSIFILEFCLYASNYHFRIPHHYLISASVSLLYGPMLYLYFRTINQNKKLKSVDILHFIPNLILLVFLIEPLGLPGAEKIRVLMGTSELYSPTYFFYLIFTPKIASLAIYGYFIRRVHLKGIREKLIHKGIIKWEKNLFSIHVIYLVSYFIYGISISGVVAEVSPVVYHIPVIAMSLMVLYIVHMAFVQPKIFMYSAYTDETILSVFKYRNSGLTQTLSDELKTSLLSLLNDEKIFKDNALSLAKLSEKLGTTRHNTSQIINEHFNMNFFELINKFRIQEAMKMLEKDTNGNLNIIDIAYEVGYNNKVTFNKAFKKETSQTPSEYLESIKISSY